MAEEKKKKRGFLSKLGFKSKEDKLAEAAAEKAAKQKLVDEQMAARMVAINAAALKSAREQDEAARDEAAPDKSAEEQAAIEAEEKRLAEIQAAKDVARAKQLAEEKARKEEEARAEAEAAAKRKEEAKARAEAKAKAEAEAAAKKEAEAKARAVEKARLEAEEKARKAAEAKARKEEEARLKAEEKAALKKARKEQGRKEAAELKAKQEAEAKARAEAEAKRVADEEKKAEEARLAAEKAEAERLEDEAKAEEEARLAAEKAEAERLEAEQAAIEKVKADRLRKEAEEAERRAAVAAQDAEREAAEKAAAEEARLKALADAPPAPEIDTLAEGGFFTRITKGLSKSTSKMSQSMSSMFNKRKLDDEALEDLQDLLIASDLGVGPALKVSELLAKDKFDKQVTDMEIKIALADVISEILTPLEKPLVLTSAKPQIMLFVGVNGSGKTTTLGKIAKRYTDQGKKVLLAAGDTFRAAAVEQLTIWGERSGAPVISGKLGADAAGLVYDAIEKAKTENYDILMIDTAGRLQNRIELMDELAKVVRVIKKADAAAPHHCVLVLDATVGQNALSQTEVFRDVAGVTGLIMTKLDGTAKGGVLVALSDKFKLPIHHIGIGERIEDLENFSAPVFAAALSGVADAMVES